MQIKPAPGSTAGTQANRALSLGSQVPLGAPLFLRNTAKQTNRISRCILCRRLKLPLGSSQGPPQGPSSPSTPAGHTFPPTPTTGPVSAEVVICSWHLCPAGNTPTAPGTPAGPQTTPPPPSLTLGHPVLCPPCPTHLPPPESPPFPWTPLASQGPAPLSSEPPTWIPLPPGSDSPQDLGQHPLLQEAFQLCPAASPASPLHLRARQGVKW